MPKGQSETRRLRIGDQAPDFGLQSQFETQVRLSDLRGQKVLLAFYPYDWSPV